MHTSNESTVLQIISLLSKLFSQNSNLQIEGLADLTKKEMEAHFREEASLEKGKELTITANGKIQEEIRSKLLVILILNASFVKELIMNQKIAD